MLEKLYFAVCELEVLSYGLIFIIGYLTPIIAVAFGFIAISLVFMGMMGVLPLYVTDNTQLKN
ncbi:MAG: hypothetical protein ACR2MD_18920 [Aridibacter sp.]|jgi:hypothetical protein